MKRRWGLQAKMTATYVAVTAGAVLLTELVIFGAAALSPPTPLTPQDLLTRTRETAVGMAAKQAVTIVKAGRPPGTALGTPGIPVTPGQAQPDSAGGVAVPQTSALECDLAPASFAVIVSRAGRVLASSYPACYPVGGQGSSAQAGVPRKVLTLFRWPVESSGQEPLPSGNVVWAAAPIVLAPAGQGPKEAQPSGPSPGPSTSATGGTGSGGKVFGMLYLEVPAAAAAAGGISVSPALIRTGLAVLAVAVPAGLAFGLLSTRRLTRRLKRLDALTLEVADGSFERRVPVSGHDEVSHLEENFNRMAGQLQASLDARRQLAEANARHAERARIARELHDSISQELFSLSVLAGGLRRALPPGSGVLTEVETMERTAGDTMREMQSLLLALRPVALDELGLASAIEGICHAYTERAGVQVRADLEPVELSPALEHAILRVTQEALANAVRHADADRITVRLRAAREPVAGGEDRNAAAGDHVLLEITDNGRGFDVAARRETAVGLGLSAMRDRVTEHGGRLSIDSAPGTGTRVRACFPLAAR
jgi:two-component system, NarL family, sensor histidine kinase LiaS